MNEDLINRLGTVSGRLHERARALAHPNQDHDISLLMQGLAVTMEALRTIGEQLNDQRGR